MTPDATTARTIADDAAARTAEALRAGRLTEEERAALVEAVGDYCTHQGKPDYTLPNWCRECDRMVRGSVATTVEAILAARAQPQDALAAVDPIAVGEAAGHWAASENSGPDDLVCECGLPWTPGEGCAFVQGARAALAGSGAEVGREAAAKAWDEAVQALAWALDNSDRDPLRALTYIRENNPHRTPAPDAQTDRADLRERVAEAICEFLPDDDTCPCEPAADAVLAVLSDAQTDTHRAGS